MILTLGEPMMVFNGPPDTSIGLATPLHTTFAGAESNLAIALARLGHNVRYLTILGDDLFGQTIAKSLKGEGIDTSAIQFDTSHPTGVMFKNRWPGDHPQVLYYRNTSAFAHASPASFDPTLWRDAKLIFLTGITPALSPSCLALFTHVLNDAANQNIPVWFDPNYRKKLWSAETFQQTLAPLLPKIHTILPSLAEGQMLTGKSDPGEIACKLMGMGAKNVILKAGPAGAVAYAPGASIHQNSLPLKKIADPIGAGDAFDAGYLSAQLDNLSVHDSLRRAHALAAMVCLTQGDWEGLPNRNQLSTFLQQNEEADR